MKRRMFYIAGTPFGEFFYDPEMCRGIAVHEDGGVMCLGMDPSWDPREDPRHVECEVDMDVYLKLFESASKYKEGVSGLRDALSHFPRKEPETTSHEGERASSPFHEQ